MCFFDESSISCFSVPFSSYRYQIGLLQRIKKLARFFLVENEAHSLNVILPEQF